MNMSSAGGSRSARRPLHKSAGANGVGSSISSPSSRASSQSPDMQNLRVEPALVPQPQSPGRESEPAEATVAVNLHALLGLVEGAGRVPLSRQASQDAKVRVLAEAERMIQHVQNHDAKQKLLKSQSMDLKIDNQEKEKHLEMWAGTMLVNNWYRRWKTRQTMRVVMNAAAAKSTAYTTKLAELAAERAAIEDGAAKLADALQVKEVENAGMRSRLQQMEQQQVSAAQQLSAAAAETSQLRVSLVAAQELLSRSDQNRATAEQDRDASRELATSKGASLEKMQNRAAAAVVLRWSRHVAFAALRSWQLWSTHRRRMLHVISKAVGTMSLRSLATSFKTWITLRSDRLRNRLVVAR